jgi:uncharacterized protein
MRGRTGTSRSGQRLWRVSIVLILAQSLAGHEAEAASLDCAEAAGDVDKTICHDAALSELDQSVESLFLSASNALTGQRHQALQASQRDWLQERTKCTGSALAQCLYERYRTRLLVLEVQYGQGDSTQPLIYRCDQLEHEVSASFFKTAPPAVSLSLGGARNEPVMAVLQPSDKGERYVTAEGLVFWASGEDASLSLSNGKKTACHLK